MADDAKKLRELEKENGRQKKIVAITSGLGSIAIAGAMPQGPYFYRMSKAALNMGLQGLGADL